MPRETIHTGRQPDDSSFDVKVGWNKDMGVQVGIAEADGRSMWWVYSERRKDIIGSRLIEIVSNRTLCKDINEECVRVAEDALNMFDVECGIFDSLWANLDRREINELIRVLRRARDSAFGRDE